MELVKDYDCNINYHSEKGNVVTDAFSRKALGNLVVMVTTQKETLKDLEKYEIEVMMVDSEAYLTKRMVQSSQIEKIKKAQGDDPQPKKIMETLQKTLKEFFFFFVTKDGSLKFMRKLFVLEDEGIK